jgi:hypothetical protein
MNPITTRTLAEWLDRTEPQVADLVRRGKIQPAPVVVAGRRLWTAGQARQAAAHFDLQGDEFERLLASHCRGSEGASVERPL